ncbi:MAG TPA: hypothetical protein VKU41_03945 [Polyangiaceae bacterium]|nr:hypothetical protein [Polyangiaceae bacterium]
MRLAFPMPWQTFQNMTLSDLESIFVYMREVATQYGNVSLVGTADKMIPMPAMYCDTTMPCGAGMTCSSTTTTGGECLANTCARDGDCAVCQKCSAVDGGTGVCQALTGAALAGCEANGY